jgi:glycosyltransferase involved in cell wall biosynthesis
LRILHVTPTFYPAIAYGGPIVSTYALCNALSRLEDVEVKVLTTDAAGPSSNDRVDVVRFPSVYPGGYEVYFTRRIMAPDISPGLFARLAPMIGWADVVQLTGTYSLPTIPTLAIAKLWGRPVLWSPRGALLASETWERASRQRLKRAWELACARVMPRRTMFHVTSEEEARASLARIPTAGAAVIPNGIDIPVLVAHRPWRVDGRLSLMFIGRLDPVKALDRIIEAIALIRNSSVTLNIYGSGAPAYCDSLKALASAHGVAEQVHFHGHVQDDAKHRAFATADICLLASHSENFGMAVAEALAHGVPVIVSKGVPWAAVEQRGCGRWVENTPAGLAAAIRSMERADLPRMGAAGRRWMTDDFGWDGIAGRMREVMTELLDREPRNQSDRVGARL